MKLHLPKQLFTAILTAYCVQVAQAEWNKRNDIVWFYDKIADYTSTADGLTLIVPDTYTGEDRMNPHIAAETSSTAARTVYSITVDNGATLTMSDSLWPGDDKYFGNYTIQNYIIGDGTGAGSFALTQSASTVSIEKVAGTLNSVNNKGTLTIGAAGNTTALSGSISNWGTLNLKGTFTASSLSGFSTTTYGSLSNETHGYAVGKEATVIASGGTINRSDFSFILGETDITESLTTNSESVLYIAEDAASSTSTIYEITSAYTTAVEYNGTSGDTAGATGFKLRNGTTVKLTGRDYSGLTDGIRIAAGNDGSATVSIANRATQTYASLGLDSLINVERGAAYVLNIDGTGTVVTTDHEGGTGFHTAGEISITNGGKLSLNNKDTLGWGGSATSKISILNGTLAIGGRQTCSTVINMQGGAVIQAAENPLTGGDAPMIQVHTAMTWDVSDTENVVKSDVKFRMNNTLNLNVVNGGELSIKGEFDGSSQLTKSGDGKLILDGVAKTINGQLQMTGGTLQLGGTTASDGLVTLAGGINHTAGTVQVAGEAAITGDSVLGGALVVSGGTANMNGAVTNSGTITVSGGTATFANTLSMGAGAALTVSGGTANMNGAVTNSGTITVSGGTATFANTLSMETGAALTVSGGTANMNGSFNVTGTSVTVSQSGNGVLNLGGGIAINEGAAATFNGQVGIGSTITNNGTLTLNDSITIIGELSAFTQRGEATVSYKLANNEISENNGFRVISGASYWLTSEVSTGTTNVATGITTVQHDGNSYNLNQDNGEEGEGTSNNWYFQVASNVGKEYYVTSGDVVVNNTVQTKATSGYVLQGGNMQLKEGQVSTSAISYTSGTIKLSDGAVLVLDSESGSLTAQNLLTGILSASPSSEGATPTGKLQIKQNVRLGNPTAATYTGVVELVNATLTAGGAPGDSVDISAISEFILNGTSEIYYHANPTAGTDIKKITVESGIGSLYLRDSDNAPMTVGSVDIEADATFKFWSNWHDSALTINSLTGQGTFRAESADNTVQNPNVTVSSLQGFEGSLEFVKDTTSDLNVEVNTGEGGKVMFNSLTTTNSNGAMDFDFNVQTDTTVGTINVTGTNNTINIASTGTLHAFTKAGEGTITLTGSGKYALGNSNTLTNGVTLADTWEGTLVYSNAARDNNITTNVTNLAGLSTSDKAVQISGTIGYLNAGDDNALGVDIVLENPTDGYALTIANGNSDQTAIISGAVSGTGDIAFNPQYYSNKWSWGNVKYQFSGNIADWTGNFIFQNTTTDTNDVLTVIFSDNATSIHANLINNNKVDVDNGISSANTSDKFNLEITNTQKVDVYGTVDVDKVTVTNTGETNFHSSLKAATVELGTAATITGKDGGTVSMAKVKMNATGFSSSDTTGATKGSISDANVEIAQLAEDASFTIQDMTLTNTTITAATPTTQVKLQNVEATNLALAQGKFTMNVAPTVGMGGTTAEFGSGVVSLLAVGSASLTLNMDVIGAYESTGAMDGVTLTITLAGITGDVSGYGVDDWKALVGFEENSWLDLALTDAQYTVSGVAPAAEGGVPSVNYGYAATGGEGSNVGTLTITINGLNVPEPATATLSLLALAALAARRRRND